MVFFGPSSVKRGRTQIVFGWNMSGASSSTYPENLGSGGLLPSELGGRVCLFCPSRYVARHRKPRRCVYVLNLGGTDIRPPGSFSYRSNFRFRSRFRSRSSSSSTTSGDLFYCSGSRQLNHSSSSCIWLSCSYKSRNASIGLQDRHDCIQPWASVKLARWPSNSLTFTKRCLILWLNSVNTEHRVSLESGVVAVTE